MSVRFNSNISLSLIEHDREYEMISPLRSSSSGGAHSSRRTVPVSVAVKFTGEPLGAVRNVTGDLKKILLYTQSQF